ncbi:hypothetical protein [Brachyspira sp.]|uniref:hypothetical protein n=1 Tax=Brachyspira sp. TaxID=1977261 RepID=UPI003D7DF9F8
MPIGNDDKNKFAIISHCHYEDEVRSNPVKRNFIILDCHASCQRHAYGVEARNDKKNKVAMTELLKIFAMAGKNSVITRR